MVTLGRVTDIDDLIVNTLGTSIVFVIYALVKKNLKKRAKLWLTRNKLEVNVYIIVKVRLLQVKI